MVFFLALNTFLLALRGHHVLVRSDNMTVVVFISHQGAIRSHSLHRFARGLHLWTQGNFLSLTAVLVLSRDNIAPGDYSTSPASSGQQMDQGSQMLSLLDGTTLEELDVVSLIANGPLIGRV